MYDNKSSYDEEYRLDELRNAQIILENNFINSSIKKSTLSKIWLRIKRSVKIFFNLHDENWMIAKVVFNRLMLRHAMLLKLEEIEHNYIVHKSMESKKNSGFAETIKTTNGLYGMTSGQSQKINRNIRAYSLATTDLFVEKAIAYLEVDYGKYIFNGRLLFFFGYASILTGIGLSIHQTLPFILGQSQPPSHDNLMTIISSIPAGWNGDLKQIILYETNRAWREVLSTFIRAFTLYGMLVLFAVGCWRLGKAMMDQAERLRERRHSLRQGRLFIHLNNGEVTVDDLEKAFDWNVSKGNAFANIPTEASAPWGGVIKEMIKAIPEIFRKGKDQIKS
jgi:hypothetical protein